VPHRIFGLTSPPAGTVGGCLNEEPSMIESSTVVNIDQLEPGELLSPELVLVLPPELRANALARLGPPQWAKPRPLVRVATPPAKNSLTPTLGAVLLPRVSQLMLTFVVVTVLTLTLSAVANAIRDAGAPHFSSRRAAGAGGGEPVATFDSQLLSVFARAGECQTTARVGQEGRPVAMTLRRSAAACVEEQTLR
jgi:hypothetical protein